MRRICFIITSFIHYSRSILILEELNRRSDVELHVVIAGTALLSKYTSRFADIRTLLKDDGFERVHELYFSLEGDNHVVRAKTTGLGIVEFTTMLNDIKPDVVVVRGDRYEVLSATIAAAYLNIPTAHIEGGDVSGTLDESVRHAITKLAHIHFATNDDSKERVLKMGENPAYVFNFGDPSIEFVKSVAQAGNGHVDFMQTGSGASFDPNEDFLMVMFHPVWHDALTPGALVSQTNALLEVIRELDMPALWFWPNADVGSEEISHELRVFRDQVKDHKIRFSRYLPPKAFIQLLNKTRALVGNSSAGIKESSFLGVPVVNVGSRQDGRTRAQNVLDVVHESAHIKKALEEQLNVGRFEPSYLYSSEDTARNIAEVLASAKLYTQKVFHGHG